MKIKITIPQIRCRKVTHPRTAKDEIYLGYFVTLMKEGSDGPEIRKYLSKKVSDVKYKVKKHTKWQPEGMQTIIETEDAKAFFITMGLYEFDNRKIYRKLKNLSDVLVKPEEYDWSIIEIPTDLTNWFSWVKAVWKLVSYSFNYFMEDDLLGTKSLAVPDLDNETARKEWSGTRELKFKSWGGDYRVTIQIEVEDE